MINSGTGQDDTAMKHENKLPIHQRKDSYQEEEPKRSRENLEALDDIREDKSSSEGQDAYLHRPSINPEPNQYLQSLQQETREPTLSPIYPWISPPQVLPGPYDAPYYPPPLPTIKTEESLQVENQSSNIKTEATTEDVPEELETISYTRRISASSIPDHDSLLEGTVTVSSKGWRRTQWSVTAG
jgi:hypothetical protein